MISQMEYVLYRGEDLLIVGTAKELAAYMETSVNMVHSICSKTKRGIQGKTNRGYKCYKIEDDTDDEEKG